MAPKADAAKPKLAVAKTDKPAEAASAVAKHAAPSAPVKGGGKKPPPKRESNDTRKITVLFKENPAREGTLAHRTHEIMRKCDGKTVADFRKACAEAEPKGDPGYFKWYQDKGHIKLT